MGARILVVAAPTVDLTGDGAVPGGPGFYAAASALVLGCSVDVLGPVGLDDLHLVARAYSALGARLLGPLVPGCSYRFRHTYKPGGPRVSRIECRPPPLSPGDLSAARGRYDALLVSPVGCEVPPSLAPLAPQVLGAPLAALDLQGFARCGLEPRLAGYGILHASTDDLGGPPEPPPAGLVVYTTGPEGGLIIARGSSQRLPPPPRLCRDPTGAGDALMGAALCLKALKGLDAVEALRRAVEVVPEALRAAREVAGSTAAHI